MEHLSSRLLVSLALISAAILALMLLFAPAKASPPIATLTATPTPPPAPAWPPPKMAAAIATAQADPRPRPPRVYKPGPHNPDPTPIAGIDNEPARFPEMMRFSVRNMWQGPVGSQWVKVFAGVEPGRPYGKRDQGELWLWAMLTDRYGANQFKEIGRFPAPVGPDSLTITAVGGVIMHLRTDSGKTLTFNLQTHRYQ